MRQVAPTRNSLKGDILLYARKGSVRAGAVVTNGTNTIRIKAPGFEKNQSTSAQTEIYKVEVYVTREALEMLQSLSTEPSDPYPACTQLDLLDLA